MAVKIAPISVIKANLGLEPNGRVQKFFTQTCAIHMDKYVPYDEGNLADYRIEDNKVIYQQPYAQYQYYGISKSGNPLHYNPDMHPQASSYWDIKMWSAEKDDVIKEVQDYIRRH
jgi:hypothetical protein